MRRIRHSICISLMLMLLCLCMAVPAMAAGTPVASGTHGTNLSWTLDRNGCLTITGSGDFADSTQGGTPWNAYAGQITSVVVGDGITGVGNYAFYKCENLKQVTLGDTVRSVGSYAFYGCVRLETVNAASALSSVYDYGFYGCEKLTGIPGVTFSWVGKWSFARCTALESIDLAPSMTNNAFGTGAFYLCSSLTEVTVPASVNAVPSSVFAGCTSLSKVTMDYKVISIGDSAFEDCISLTAVEIPGWTTTIYGSAFRNTGLTTVNIPGNVTTIAGGAFASCKDLMSITVDRYNSKFTSINGVLYADSGTTLHTYPAGLGGAVSYHYKVTKIGSYAFSGCTKVTGITFGTSTTSLGGSVFENCTGLTQMKLPDRIVKLGTFVFSGCSNLKTVEIGSGVKTLTNSLFRGCTSLEEFLVPKTVETMEGCVFSGCTNLKHISFKDYLPEMDDSAFYGVTANCYYYYVYSSSDLSDYGGTVNWVRGSGGKCGDDLTWVLDWQDDDKMVISGTGPMWDYGTSHSSMAPWLKDNNAVESLVVEPGATSIGKYAFYSDTLLTTVELPDTLETIAPYAFYNCRIPQLRVPAGVKEIGDYAFGSCSSLEKIVFAGKAPAIHTNGFRSVTAQAFYPTADTSWTEDARQNYGGTITWIPDCCLESHVQEEIPPVAPTCGHTGLTSGVRCSRCGLVLTEPDSVAPTGNHTFLDNICTLCGAETGRCSEGVTWVFNGNTNTLHIMGSGEIPDYPLSSGSPTSPWSGLPVHTTVIEEGITVIGSCAFYGLSEMTSISIPDSVTDIEYAAFARCTKLETIPIPKNVVNLDLTALSTANLQGEASLKKIVVASGNQHFYSDYYGVLYTKDRTKLLRAPYKLSTSSYTIPSTVTELDETAFNYCANLSAVTIPSSVKTVTGFRSCRKLTQVNMSSGTTALGSAAFIDCSKLSYISLPATVETIGASAFSGCKALTYISIPSKVTVLDRGVFQGSGLTSVTVPEGVVRIEADAFSGCKALTKVTLPGSLTSFGASAFRNCTALKQINIPEKISAISSAQFLGCSSLETITLPAQLMQVNDYAFDDSGLKEVYFTGNAPEIGEDGIFEGVTATAYYPSDNADWETFSKRGYAGSITWKPYCYGAHVETVVPGTPADCVTEGLTEGVSCSACGQVLTPQETIPATAEHTYVDAVCSVCGRIGGTCGEALTWHFDAETGVLTVFGTGDMADFASASDVPWNAYAAEIKTVSLPQGLTRIGSSAFIKCTALEEVTLPDSLQTVGERAFYSCKKLAQITLPGSVTEIGKNAFYECSALARISFLGNPPAIGTNAFGYVAATAFYGAGNENWTDGVRKPYGGTLQWKASCFGEHDVVTVPALTPNCITPGNTEGKHCAKCGEVFSVMTELPATGEHSYVDTVCQVCGHIGGTCGEDLVWTFDPDTGVLEITGTGAMDDYSRDEIPWAAYMMDNAVGVITSVSLPDGITHIGSYAFFNNHNITQMELPGSLTGIGNNAFCSTGIREITIPGTVTAIGDEAFRDSGLHTITFTGTAPTLADFVFDGITALAYYPAGDDSWDTVTNQGYGGIITWESYCYGGHDWLDASCEVPKTCSKCGETEGEVLPHNVENYNYQAASNGISATCGDCGADVGSYTLTVFDRTYDSTAVCGATVTGTVPGIPVPEVLYCCESGCRDAGSHTASITLGGVTAEVTFRIGKAELGISSVQAQSRLYDATNLIAADQVTLTGVYENDAVAVDLAQLEAAVSACDVGTYDTVILSNILLTGADASNYSIPETVEAALADPVTISKRPLTLKALDQNVLLGEEVRSGVDVFDVVGGFGIIGNDAVNWAEISGDTSRVTQSGVLTIVSVDIVASLDPNMPNVNHNYEITLLPGVLTVSCSGHSPVTDPAVAPNCTFPGKTQGSHCGLCGAVLTPQEEVPVNGVHEYVDTVCRHCGQIGGYLGDQQGWTFEEATGKLTIFGSGDMPAMKADSAPWSRYSDRITSLEVEEGITSVGELAFFLLTNLERAVLPEGLEYIHDHAFSSCYKLKDLQLPQSLLYIGNYAFWSCPSYTDISIPSKVAFIGDQAFWCDEDGMIRFWGNAPQFGSYAFENVTGKVCYPLENPSWTEDVRQNYGGNITWIADLCLDGHEESPIEDPPTDCEDDGYISGVQCTRCGEIVVEPVYIPPRPHTLVTDAAVPATCTTDGKTEGSHCSACNAVLKAQEDVPAKGHTPATDAAVAPTCTAEGKTEGSHCSVCNAVLEAQKVVPAKGHTPATDAAVAPTCTAEGKTEGSHCSVCNAVLKAQDTIPARGHTAVTDAAVAATCTTEGKTEGSHCSVCNAVLKAQETVPAKGHTPVTDAAVAPTCTAEGKTEGSHCSVCNTVLKAQEVVPANGHTPVTDAAVAATCTTEGKNEGSHCSVCNAVLKAQETVPANGHTPVTDAAVAPTCTAEGKTEGSHCSVCNAVLKAQETIPAKGHTAVTDAAVAPTCTAEGKTEGSHCSVCNAVLKAQQTVPAKGHTAVTDAAVAATCTAEGKTEGSHCSACNAVLKAQETIPAKGHTAVTDPAVAPTEEKPGKTEGSHCSVCGAVIKPQEEIPALGHTHKPVTDAAVAPSCTAPGKTEGSHCSSCGAILKPQQEIAPAHSYGHDFDYKCDLCGETREVDMTRPMVDMFRMYNPNTGEHFYTGSEEERDNLIGHGWQYEGVGFTFPLTTGDPVHRLFQPSTGEHLYTMDVNEKDALLAAGWNYEGIAFNSGFENEVPQYRLHNPNATVGAYHFTASAEERDNLLSAGWEYQGIGWYSLGSMS